MKLLSLRWSGMLLVLLACMACAKPFPEVRVQQLPIEAQTTYQLIQHGGPFPYRQDGVVFQNREKVLPIKANRSYYHEYTVPTPGVSSRGARRIVCGPAMDCYYTQDHYRSFRRIVK